MAESTRIRFVGGPLHNELVEVSELKGAYRVPHLNYEPEDLSKLPSTGPVKMVTEHVYSLWGFVTSGGTYYHQYVHSSMFKAPDVPMKQTWRENFPRLPEMDSIRCLVNIRTGVKLS